MMQICPICDTQFVVPAKNLYKGTINNHVRNFCSYTCYRKHQKDVEAQKLMQKQLKEA